MSAIDTPVPSSPEEAVRALGTKDAELRRLVVRALEQSPAAIACEVLHLVLGDEDWRVRKEGIQLAHALADRADVVTVLVSALSSPSDQVALRNAAVEALAGLGAQAAPAVERALGTGELDADGRKLAVDVLAGARQPRSIPVLIAFLGDEDANVRYAAAEALGWIGGEDAASALQQLLDREDRYLRLVALEALNRLGALVAVSRLQSFLGDKILRHAAVAALGRTEAPEAIELLVGALDDASRHVGESALRALSSMLSSAELVDRARVAAKSVGEVGRKRVLAAAESTDAHLRRSALPVLALFADPHPGGGAETDALLRALRDPDVAEDAEAALATLGRAILPALIDVARRGEVPNRAAALAVLPRIERDEEVIEVLRDALRDPDREIVAAAASAFAAALAAGVLPNAADVHALLRVASGRDAARGSAAAKAAAVALQSLRTLARVRPDAVRPHLAHVDVADDEAPVVCALLSVAGGPEHLTWLSRATTAPSARTRRAAVEALGQLGGAAAVDPLGYAVTDEAQEVALAAIKALGRLRTDENVGVGVAPLLRLLEAGGEEATVSAAVRALGQTNDRRAVEALEPLVASPSVSIACAAIEALADLGVEVRAHALAALRHPSSVVARTALDVLDASLDERDATLAVNLGAALGHTSWEVRRRAIEIIARLDPYAVRPLLASRVPIETEPAVREALDRALNDLDRRMAKPSRPPPSGFPQGGE